MADRFDQAGRLLAVASLLRLGYSPRAVAEALKWADQGDSAEAIAALQRDSERARAALAGAVPPERHAGG